MSGICKPFSRHCLSFKSVSNNLNLLMLQGFSGMNRFNKSAWSKVQCEMILAFLSFADYFRPKYFLLENVRNFVSFNKCQTFRLTLASLLEMGYQVAALLSFLAS